MKNSGDGGICGLYFKRLGAGYGALQYFVFELKRALQYSHLNNCNKPDFGAKLEKLNKGGFFVKYMENGGISYYKYTGPCRPTIHETATMDIGYAFIANKLYARIINLTTRKQIIEKVKNEIVKKVSKQIGTAPYEIKQDGDWWLYQWFNEKDNLKFKLKYNWKKGEGKCAFYYEPLRAELPDLKEEYDPMFLVQYPDLFL